MTRTPATDGRRTAAAARRRERQQEIITATRALFDERGVRDMKIEDVATSVGINRAIIYRHFSGKEELFALTLVGYLKDLDVCLTDAVKGKRKPTTQLRAVIEAFVDFGLAYPAFVDCSLTLMRRPGPELLEEVSESAMFRLGREIATCMEHVVIPIREGVETGEMKVDDPYQLANTLYATGLGGLQLARLGILVRPAAPGIPEVVPLPAAQVKAYLVRAALALAAA
jgi:AcrR family transcriptional regulator